MQNDNEISVEILMFQDSFEVLPHNIKHELYNFDIVSTGKFNNREIILFEDSHVIYPIEYYQKYIDVFRTLPFYSYCVKIFQSDDETLIKYIGDLHYEQDQLTFTNHFYN